MMQPYRIELFDIVSSKAAVPVSLTASASASYPRERRSDGLRVSFV